MLSLELENNQTLYAPGAQVRGVAGWDLTESPHDAKVSLLWYTEGIGTQDIGIVEEQALTGSLNHREAFVFTLPDSPYSFSGTHITLKWAVELLMNKGKDMQLKDIVVSPWGEVIKLEKVEDKDGSGIRFRQSV